MWTAAKYSCMQCQVNEVIGEGCSTLSIQLRDLLHQAEVGKSSGKVYCRKKQLLTVQYTLIRHFAQALELLVQICREVTKGRDLQLQFMVHWMH